MPVESNALKKDVYFICLFSLSVSIGSHQLGLWSLVAFLSFPICVVKNAINLIQMIGSFETIVEQDKIDRAKNK